MFSAFSWKDFVVCTFLLLIVYYTVVIFLYYKTEFRQILSRVFNTRQPVISYQAAAISGKSFSAKEADKSDRQGRPASEHASPEIPDDQAPDFNELLQTIQKLVIRAGQEEVVKQELLWMIRSILQQHHHLKNTDNIIAVNDFVIQLVENHCAISLQEEDISPLWN